MTDQTPAYWVVIYTADDWSGGPLISSPMWAKTPEEASHRIETARQGRTAQNAVGPFTDQTEAESYRQTWSRNQGKRTIADLLDATASVVHTNALHVREGRTPAQNAALPPDVNLYQAFNIVICGDPDDTRGNVNGINSADLVRTFNGFLNQGSALEWSKAPERTHAEIMNALRSCASALRDAADRGKPVTLPSFVGDTFVGPRVMVHVGDTLKHRDVPTPLIVTDRHEDRGFMLAPEHGEPFFWDDFEMPGNEGSLFTLITCPHLDQTAEPAAGDPADTEVIETGPGFPVACASVHEHDPIACAPEPTETAATESAVWAITVETFDGTDTPMLPETFVRISDMDALIRAHRAAGASVESSWPFGSDGKGLPTYVHVYADGRGVTTFRRANPGESGSAHVETDETAVFLERQNRALEAFRSRIAQEITVTLQRIESRGPDASVSASEIGRWLSDMYGTAKRDYDRQFRL